MAEDGRAKNQLDAEQIARHWCKSRGPEWSVTAPLGAGGTAPVFEVASPEGSRALKIYDENFSSGAKGEIEAKRIDQQLALKGHACPYLVQVYDGGSIDNRLFLLMSRAPGKELEKVLSDVPRAKIRKIVDQVAQATIFLRSKGLYHRDVKAANIFISDDYNHATLLDISVIRDVTDPVGAGTDQDGKLPIVATARYSPPEYLFRLLQVGEELWHALTVYQLGALLHDLIMREPLFQAEYIQSAVNRYRFAWIVATTIPRIDAIDVDHDLIFAARRALDKDWKRRSTLRLEDFLDEAGARQANALKLLGFGKSEGANSDGSPSASEMRRRLNEITNSLHDAIREYLHNNSIVCEHSKSSGPVDQLKQLVFRWSVLEGYQKHTNEFELNIQIVRRGASVAFLLQSTLFASKSGKKATMSLPEIPDAVGVERDLVAMARSSLSRLAVDAVSVTQGGGS